jgi:hypothetical protein
MVMGEKQFQESCWRAATRAGAEDLVLTFDDDWVEETNEDNEEDFEPDEVAVRKVDGIQWWSHREWRTLDLREFVSLLSERFGPSTILDGVRMPDLIRVLDEKYEDDERRREEARKKREEQSLKQ